ncbi:hypothetical protein ADUPG1_003069 [Aduncisulcus paluster]|uniref:Uncharacterized protein n=1 Tax=Aduncisulcus paluster TaxID=2918883 RepID=A0ABQ5KTR0_9EUKA|nr:hypothetical protein ADUPG1_003069 [Aduncisulcus paluster]
MLGLRSEIIIPCGGVRRLILGAVEDLGLGGVICVEPMWSCSLDCMEKKPVVLTEASSSVAVSSVCLVMQSSIVDAVVSFERFPDTNCLIVLGRRAISARDM